MCRKVCRRCATSITGFRYPILNQILRFFCFLLCLYMKKPVKKSLSTGSVLCITNLWIWNQ